MNELCVKEYNSCKCERCKVKTSYEHTEKKLSMINAEYNSVSKQYHKYLNGIYNKVGYGGRIKVNSDYDIKSKRLWIKMQDADNKTKRLIYKLTSLERTMDLYEEDDYYSVSL